MAYISLKKAKWRVTIKHLGFNGDEYPYTFYFRTEDEIGTLQDMFSSTNNYKTRSKAREGWVKYARMNGYTNYVVTR